MNNIKIKTAYFAYIDEEISNLRAQIPAKYDSGKADEAHFLKIAVNICEIFKTTLTALEKRDGEEAYPEKYPAKLDEMLGVWETGLDAARLHGDYAKAAVEEKKLEMGRKLKEVYTTLLQEKEGNA